MPVAAATATDADALHGSDSLDALVGLSRRVLCDGSRRFGPLCSQELWCRCGMVRSDLVLGLGLDGSHVVGSTSLDSSTGSSAWRGDGNCVAANLIAGKCFLVNKTNI